LAVLIDNKIPTNTLWVPSCRGGPAVGMAASNMAATPESSSTDSRRLRRELIRSPEQRDQLGLAHGRDIPGEVEQALGVLEPGGI
jgi:hypothetical protein